MVYLILFSSYMINNMHRGAGVICVNNTEGRAKAKCFFGSFNQSCHACKFIDLNDMSCLNTHNNFINLKPVFCRSSVVHYHL